jgi:GNAT superfamily N-acetyltransferase
MAYEIRQMTREDARQAWEWGTQQGWNPGLHDWELIPAIDPKGCFAGILDGKMVSSIVAVQYQRKFGFLGMYIVAPEYRGRGYGLAIWKHAMNYLTKEVGAESVGLDGVLANEPLYHRSGFHPSYRIVRFQYAVTPAFKRKYPVIEKRHFSDIADYDLKVFKVDRASFLHDFIFKSEAKTSVAYKAGKLTGFAMARPCFTGYKIGPLFADDIKVARDLIESLFAQLPGEITFIETPEPNNLAIQLTQDFGMSPDVATIRMYTNDKYDQDTQYVYGVATRVVG